MDSPEAQLAEAIRAILEPRAATPLVKRLRVRLRDLGKDQRDEVTQFRQLQKACREAPELAQAFAAAGFGDVTSVDPRVPDPKTGAFIQAFNRFVETFWEKA